MYIQQEYCENGDLFDYLSALERTLDLTEDFYWDLIFEILCVSFF